MSDEAVLGYQVSLETGEASQTPVLLRKSDHTHTIFQGDDHTDKAEAALRLALSTWQWGSRVIVLDFDGKWRERFGKYLVEQISNIEFLPLDGATRCNLLAVPQLLSPERYIALLCERLPGFAHAPIPQEALRSLYVKYGVLLRDEQVITSLIYGTVSEAEAVHLPGYAGQSVASLPDDLAQALSVLRSRYLSFQEWLDILERANVGQYALGRLREWCDVRVFGPTIGMGSRSFVVIEGGDWLNTTTRARLMGLLASILYNDAKALSKYGLDTELFVDEAQYPLTHDAYDLAELWQGGARFHCHPIINRMSLLPTVILEKCSNAFFFRSTDRLDQEFIQSFLGCRKTDATARLRLSRLPRAFCLAKLGSAKEVPMRVLACAVSKSRKAAASRSQK